MKKACLTFLSSICLCLLVASAWIVFNPTPALAAEGTANCGGFTRVRCADGATRCVCEDGVGCTSYFANGSSSQALCKDANGPAPVESAF
jgi:hypothetical protein